MADGRASNGPAAASPTGRGAAAASPYVSGLRLLNSLTGTRDLFLPNSGGRAVNEYICGPTVYASAHLGHARNYVSFDVLRRVMEVRAADRRPSLD